MRRRGMEAAAPAVEGGFHRVAVTFAGKLEVNVVAVTTALVAVLKDVIMMLFIFKLKPNIYIAVSVNFKPNTSQRKL